MKACIAPRISMSRLAAPWQVLWFLAGLGVALVVGAAAHADEIQILRHGGAERPGVYGGVMPFSTFQIEKQAAAQLLPCKWISAGGRLGPSYGNAYYDFLCKGGDWATVSLYLNKAADAPQGVGSVLLLYRDWASDVHPNAGEASTAQQFLKHVVNRFVPASKGPEVLDAFWRKGEKTWSGGGVKVRFQSEHGDGFVVRRLEVVGGEQAIRMFLTAEEDTARARQTGLMRATLPEATSAGRLSLPTKSAAPVLTIAPIPVVPHVSIPHGVAPLPVVLPQPQNVPVLPERLSGGSQPLNIPENTPAGGKGMVLPSATEAELNTAPAPESKAKPTPPPTVSSSLVPDADMLVYGRAKAPANFDIYNKAEALTRSEEQRAFGKSSPDKVTPAAPQTTAGLAKPAAPALMKVPAETSASLVATGGLATAPSESTAAVAAPVATSVAPGDETEGYSRGLRPLPQLKFVPKAEPLKNPAETLTFEDEKSKL